MDGGPHFLILTQFANPAILRPLWKEGGRPCEDRKEVNVSNRECILVIDEIADTADVLKAVMEPRGHSVNRVRHVEDTGRLDSHDRPTVIILDAESRQDTAPALGRWQNVPQVIIGTIVPSGETADASPPNGAGRRFLEKPFQFAALIEAIESLVAQAR